MTAHVQESLLSVAPSASVNWIQNPGSRGWRCESPQETAIALHRTLPGYAPTPLRELPELAEELGVGGVYVKDESERFDLGAFKFLGASWAVFRTLAERSGYSGGYEMEGLRTHLRTRTGHLTVVSATDGNHGRAVARMAAILGIRAQIFVPRGVPQLVVDRVQREGAGVVVLETDYDGAVKAARVWVDAHPEAVIVQDTSWDGYERVPGWIVEGYSTLFLEIDQQLEAAGIASPDLVAVPVGVGSLAQAAVAHYRSSAVANPPGLLAVEPDTAACVLTSIREGGLTTVETGETVMNGLNCGTPSLLAWPFLRGGLDAVVAVTDEQCRAAMVRLDDLGVFAGPSGAAGYAGLVAALGRQEKADSNEFESAVSRRRAFLGLNSASVLVCLSTEGPID